MKKRTLLFLTVGVLLVGVVLLSMLPARTDIGDREDGIQKKLAAMQREIKARGWTFEVGDNEALQYDLNQICGFNPALKMDNSIPEYTIDSRDGKLALPMALPSSYTGYYTSIKNQGSCGSCWAFGCVGNFEGVIKKRKGVTVNLSEQYLLSCNPYGYGCNGGYFDANNMLTSKGCYYESCFPYVGYKATCKTSCSFPYRATGWAYVGSSSSVPTTTAIKTAIYNYGTVAAAVAADYYFQAYRSGVFGTTTSTSVNHAIILCGWNDSYGAWYLKNSWGTSWGLSGFMWIKYGVNRVGYGANYIRGVY